MRARDRWRTLRIRALNWEYWPWRIVYIPLFIQYFWHGLRSGFSFPTVLNRPYMEYGGIIEESKWQMYTKTPEGFMPATLFHPAGSDPSFTARRIRELRMSYPLIAKPDRGMRGKGIEIIASEKDLRHWNPHPDFDFILQTYLDYPLEIGAFVIRDPGNREWRVSSLMQREFLGVTGDGSSDLEQLIRANDRAFLQLERWRKNNRYNLKTVLPAGKYLKLEDIGNHRLGTCFRDISHLGDTQLCTTLSQIANQLPGFEYGRMDIRFDSWDTFLKLQNWALIEVNGANSEPAHIYDPGHSLFYAWKSLLHHFALQHKLAAKRIQTGEKPILIRQAKQLLKRYNHTMTDLD